MASIKSTGEIIMSDHRSTILKIKINAIPKYANPVATIIKKAKIKWIQP